jgi:hypothetical protein
MTESEEATVPWYVFSGKSADRDRLTSEGMPISEERRSLRFSAMAAEKEMGESR